MVVSGAGTCLIRFILHSLSARVLFDNAALSNLDAKGNVIDLSIYKGKVLLIVNVASQCGLTNSNYIHRAKPVRSTRTKGAALIATDLWRVQKARLSVYNDQILYYFIFIFGLKPHQFF